MIDADQLRAARAILKWKASDLSEKTGIAANTISSIERGITHGRRDTMEKFQAVFEESGLEFLPDSGIRKKNKIIFSYEGEDCLETLHDDVYETLRDSKGEMLIAHLDEGVAAKSLNPEVIDKFIRRRKAAGISSRLLVKESDPNLIPPYDTYRAIPDEFFSPYPFYIYGTKLALVSWKPSPRVVIIDDERFTESARKLFDIVWRVSKRIIREE